MKYNIISYKTVNGILPASSGYIDVLLGMSFPTTLEWVLWNDATGGSLFVKMNETDDLPIVLKPGEYLGGQRSLHQVFLSTVSLADIDYRLVLKVIGDDI